LKDLSIDGDNIKINIGEIRQGGVKLIDLTQGRNSWQTHVKKVIKQGVAHNAGNLWIKGGTMIFYIKTFLHGFSNLVI